MCFSVVSSLDKLFSSTCLSYPLLFFSFSHWQWCSRDVRRGSISCLAAECRCSAWEFSSDGTLLAGIEVCLPSIGLCQSSRHYVLWETALAPLQSAHEMVAARALRCLQHRYGFVVHDYNFNSMLAYRRLARDAVQAALSTSGCVAHFRSSHGAFVPWCDNVLRTCSSLYFSFFIEDMEQMGSFEI